MEIREISHYRVIRSLGEGGMASIYLAQDTRLDRYVAVKILTREKERDASHLARFRQEAKLASSVNHPNVLTIFEIVEWEDMAFLVTEFVDGETLRKTISHGPLPLLNTLRIADQITRALIAAHDYWIVHRDLKPANIMVRADEVVKLLDFGLAKLSFGSSPPLTAPGAVPGSILYIAPERLQGEEADPRSDIYSFGLIMWEMTTGRHPYENVSFAEAVARATDEDLPRLDSLDVEIPSDFADLVERATDRDPSRRFQTARAVMNDLSRILKRVEWEALEK